MLRFAYYDNKLGLDHAVALAKEGHRVKYFHEWRFRYMRLEDYMVGRNLHENLEVVEDFFQSDSRLSTPSLGITTTWRS